MKVVARKIFLLLKRLKDFLIEEYNNYGDIWHGLGRDYAIQGCFFKNQKYGYTNE